MKTFFLRRMLLLLVLACLLAACEKKPTGFSGPAEYEAKKLQTQNASYAMMGVGYSITRFCDGEKPDQEDFERLERALSRMQDPLLEQAIAGKPYKEKLKFAGEHLMKTIQDYVAGVKEYEMALKDAPPTPETEKILKDIASQEDALRQLGTAYPAEDWECLIPPVEK